MVNSGKQYLAHTMQSVYLTTTLTVISALVASAQDVPKTARNAVDLLPVLRECHGETNPERILSVLEKLPEPTDASHVFKHDLKCVHTFACLMRWCILPESQRNAYERKVAETSPQIWYFLKMFQHLLALSEGNTEWAASLKQELIAYLEKGTEPNAGIKELFVRVEHVPSSEQFKLMPSIFAQYPDDSLVQRALGVMNLNEKYALGINPEIAVKHLAGALALRTFEYGGVADEHLYLALERVAYLQGECSLLLRLASLLPLVTTEQCTGATAQRGAAAYNLADVYRRWSRLHAGDATFASMGNFALKTGAQLAHPACLYEYGATLPEEQVSNREYLQSAAIQKGYDSKKDYVVAPLSNNVKFGINSSTCVLPNPEEDEVRDYLYSCLGKVGQHYVNHGDLMVLNSLFDVTRIIADYSDALGEDSTHHSQISDADLLDGSILDKMEKMLQQEYLIQIYVDKFLLYAKRHDHAPEEKERIRVILQQLAERGESEAVFRLAANDIILFDAWFSDAHEVVMDAFTNGSPDAAWFLYEALKDGKFGLTADEEDAVLFEQASLAFCSAEAWQLRLQKAATDEERLLALIHLCNSSEGGKYVMALDDALIGYATKYPQLKDSVNAVRLLYFAEIGAQDLAPSEYREYKKRHIELALEYSPVPVPQHQIDYYQSVVENCCLGLLNRNRAQNAVPAITLLQNDKAEMVFIRDGVMKTSTLNQTLAENADALKGSDVVLKEVDDTIAQQTIQAGVRSVTALKMTLSAYKLLNSKGILAGAYEFE